MGLPVTERGGPPGGGGIDRPEALVGGCEGADGGAAGATDAAGASGAAGATGAAGSSEAAGAAAGASAGVAAAGAVVWVVGAVAAGALTAAAGALAAAAGALAAGAEDAGAAGAIGVTGATEAAGAAAGRLAGVSAGFSGPGRLVTSLAPDRLIGVGAAGSPSSESVVGFEAAALPSWSASLPVPVARVVAAAFFAGAFLVAAAFLTGGAGSSGWTSRRRPSRSALRRARSACASSMEDEWLFTPIPRDRHRSSASLLVNPSSCASS
jgi:pilus assembly protein FimV